MVNNLDSNHRMKINLSFEGQLVSGKDKCISLTCVLPGLVLYHNTLVTEDVPTDDLFLLPFKMAAARALF